MPIFTFENIKTIQKVQFLTDSSGYVLDNNGKLSAFIGNETNLLATPENINITDFHFITENNGAIIGNDNFEINGASFFQGSGFWILIFFLTLFFWKKIKNKVDKKGSIFILGFLLLFGVVVACNRDWENYVEQDENSPFTTLIKRNSLGNGFHNFGGNAGQKAYFSQTIDGGKNWETHKIPTNFNVTSIVSIGENYFVGTYAGENHQDGDIWIFGNDSTYCKLLGKNNSENPFFFSANRGINGLKYYPKDSTLVLYGSGLINKFPKDENNSTEGNITELKAAIFSDYKILRFPDFENALVTSYTKNSENNIFVTLQNGVLAKTEGKEWIEVEINNDSKFKQIEFIPETETGYALSVSGFVYKTESNGEKWEKLEQTSVEKLILSKNEMLLVEGNRFFIDK